MREVRLSKYIAKYVMNIYNRLLSRAENCWMIQIRILKLLPSARGTSHNLTSKFLIQTCTQMNVVK